MAVVTGVAYWASVQAPNTTYEAEYSVDLVVSEADAEKLRNQNITVGDRDGEPMVKFKRRQFRKDGTENPKPKVVDSDAMPMDDLIGNGSKVNVQYRTYPWTYAGRSGVGADLVGVQVLELVAYGGSEFKPVEVPADSEQPEQPTTKYTGDEPFDE